MTGSLLVAGGALSITPALLALTPAKFLVLTTFQVTLLLAFSPNSSPILLGKKDAEEECGEVVEEADRVSATPRRAVEAQRATVDAIATAQFATRASQRARRVQDDCLQESVSG